MAYHGPPPPVAPMPPPPPGMDPGPFPGIPQAQFDDYPPLHPPGPFLEPHPDGPFHDHGFYDAGPGPGGPPKKEEHKHDKNSEAETAKVDVTYEGYILEPAEAKEGERLSWARVGKRMLPFEEKKLVAMVKAHRKRTRTGPAQDFANLKSNQQGVINRLILQRKQDEKNKNADWTLVDVQPIGRRRWGSVEVHQIQIVLKRHPKDQTKAGAISSNSAQNAYHAGEIIDLADPPNKPAAEKKPPAKKSAAKKEKPSHGFDQQFGYLDGPLGPFPGPPPQPPGMGFPPPPPPPPQQHLDYPPPPPPPPPPPRAIPIPHEHMQDPPMMSYGPPPPPGPGSFHPRDDPRPPFHNPPHPQFDDHRHLPVDDYPLPLFNDHPYPPHPPQPPIQPLNQPPHPHFNDHPHPPFNDRPHPTFNDHPPPPFNDHPFQPYPGIGDHDRHSDDGPPTLPDHYFSARRTSSVGEGGGGSGGRKGGRTRTRTSNRSTSHTRTSTRSPSRRRKPTRPPSPQSPLPRRHRSPTRPPAQSSPSPRRHQPTPSPPPSLRHSTSRARLQALEDNFNDLLRRERVANWRNSAAALTNLTSAESYDAGSVFSQAPSRASFTPPSSPHSAFTDLEAPPRSSLLRRKTTHTQVRQRQPPVHYHHRGVDVEIERSRPSHRRHHYPREGYEDDFLDRRTNRAFSPPPSPRPRNHHRDHGDMSGHSRAQRPRARVRVHQHVPAAATVVEGEWDDYPIGGGGGGGRTTPLRSNLRPHRSYRHPPPTDVGEPGYESATYGLPRRKYYYSGGRKTPVMAYVDEIDDVSLVGVGVEGLGLRTGGRRGYYR